MRRAMTSLLRRLPEASLTVTAATTGAAMYRRLDSRQSGSLTHSSGDRLKTSGQAPHIASIIA